MHSLRLHLLLPACLLPMYLVLSPGPNVKPAGASPTPAPDPLAVPVLPDHPTEIDLGRVTYYYHCMPCHGDNGQGLTDEWREVWVEDHRDCWARGCHGGRPDDLGFALPPSIPPVMPPFSSLARFTSADDLAEFLQADHPPQSPGILDEAECRNLAAYLTRTIPPPPVISEDTPARAERGPSLPSPAAVIRAGLALVAVLSVAWLVGSREVG